MKERDAAESSRTVERRRRAMQVYAMVGFHLELGKTFSVLEVQQVLSRLQKDVSIAESCCGQACCCQGSIESQVRCAHYKEKSRKLGATVESLKIKYRSPYLDTQAGSCSGSLDCVTTVLYCTSTASSPFEAGRSAGFFCKVGSSIPLRSCLHSPDHGQCSGCTGEMVVSADRQPSWLDI